MVRHDPTPGVTAAVTQEPKRVRLLQLEWDQTAFHRRDATRHHVAREALIRLVPTGRISPGRSFAGSVAGFSFARRLRLRFPAVQRETPQSFAPAHEVG